MSRTRSQPGARRAMTLAPFLVLLADTKFRARDSHAILEGAVDGQIVFELAMLGIAGLVALLALSQRPRGSSPPHPTLTLLFVYAGLAILSTFWSPIRSLTFVRGVELIVVVVVAWATVDVLGPRDAVRSLARVLPFFVLLASAMTVLLPGTVTYRLFQSAQGVPRFTWFAVHPGIAATVTALAVIAVVPVFTARKTSGDLGSGAFLVAVVVALIGVLLATRARSQLLALILTLLAMSARYRFRPSSRLAVALLLGSAGIAFWIVVAPWGMDSIDVTRMTGPELASFMLRGQTPSQFASLSGRLELWQSAWPLFLESPFLGNGYVASREALLAIVPWASYAHNGLMQSLLDLGMIGTLVLWGLAVRGVWIGARMALSTNYEAAVVEQTIFGVLCFLVLNAGAGESFAGVPGFAVYIFFVGLLVAERMRGRDASGQTAQPSPAHPAAL